MASVARYEEGRPDWGATAPPRQHRAAADNVRSMGALIEREIIPRLMAAHLPLMTQSVPPHSRVRIDADDVAALVPLALHVEADALLAHVEAVLAQGVTVETVLVEMLAPAARLLGEYWEDDRGDFIEVTMALWRLQEVVHEIAARAPMGRLASAGGHRALFASMPGDQHDFGTVVIDEVFQRDGWRTDRLIGAETSGLLRRVSDNWFDLIGLTVSCDCHIAPLPSLLAALRNVSRNPRVCIMVGGRVFSADAGLAATVGADGTASDAIMALKRASELVRAREAEVMLCS